MAPKSETSFPAFRVANCKTIAWWIHVLYIYHSNKKRTGTFSSHFKQCQTGEEKSTKQADLIKMNCVVFKVCCNFSNIQILRTFIWKCFQVWRLLTNKFTVNLVKLYDVIKKAQSVPIVIRKRQKLFRQSLIFLFRKFIYNLSLVNR